MKRNQKLKIPSKNGDKSIVFEDKSKNTPGNCLSKENESCYNREVHASRDSLPEMQFKQPSKLPKLVHAKKDSNVGNVYGKNFESRKKEFSDNDKPYYNESSRFEDQNYYSTSYDNRVGIPHKGTKEAERGKRSCTEISYHSRPSYDGKSKFENQNYFSSDYDERVRISDEKTEKIEKDKKDPSEYSYHDKPYYNASSKSGVQNYYSVDNDDRINISHKRSQETERDKRSHTGFSYHGRPYYNEAVSNEDKNYLFVRHGNHVDGNSRFENKIYYSVGYDERDRISDKRTEEIERDKRHLSKISHHGRPYETSSRSEAQNYYSADNDDRINILHKRSEEAERDKRNHSGFSYHGRPYYNKANSIEDQNYLPDEHENHVDVKYKKTKENGRDRRNQSESVIEKTPHSKIRYNSSTNDDIHFDSEEFSTADYGRIQNTTEMCNDGYEVNKETGAIPKQLFWARKKNVLHGYDNRALSMEDEKHYVRGNPKHKHDMVLSFENEPEYKKEEERAMHSRTHYHTNHSHDDPTILEVNNASLKNKFQNPKRRDNDILPNQIFEDVQTDRTHKITDHNNLLQKDYTEEQLGYHDQQRGNTKIRKRLVAANNEDYDDFQHIDDENFYRNANVKAVSNLKPLTINDAYAVAEIMLGQSKQRLSFSIDQQNSNAVISESEELTIMGRKCWSKMCFSASWHSHSITRSFQGTSVNNREAILDALPLGRPKDKSCWSKCLDLFGCFKHASAALEFWNDSLKRIEGLQGTGVVSYFVFLRWLIALNLILFILYFLLVTLPHSAFNILPLKDISIAPNESAITEEFLNKYGDLRPTDFKPKEVKNASLPLHNDDLFSNWDVLLEKLPDNILDLTLAYDRKNLTNEERRNNSQHCEAQYKAEMENNTGGILSAMQDLLQGTGWLQSTVLFLGHYPANEISYFGLVYNMPVAVIAVLFVSFVICLCMMIQYSSHGVQETILARKNDYLQYSNILFCSWDYCIEDRKSSVIRHNSILHEIKSTLAEERRKREIKEWSRGKKIKVYFLRTFINLFVIAVLCSSYYLIYRVVNYQLEEMQLHRLNKPGVNTLFVQYLSPIVITGLNIFVPIIFNNIVKLEMYNTQTQINMALFRTVFLRLSSVFVLVGLLYQQITCEPRDMCGAGITETCLSPICWETYVGQQLYKLAVTDFFVYIMMFILYDIPRDIIVRHCKNKATQMIGRQVFDLPNQVLSLVYSQTLCWLGVVYSPLLPAITVIKFVIIFYIKKQMVLKYCVPAPIPYKASRSNAMFMIILMLSFFTLMIIHGYSLSRVNPSPACSPFRHYNFMVDALSDTVLRRSYTFATIFNFFFSVLFLIPAIVLMCIAIYYYWTIVVAHRKMVKVLKAQIAIEGHDKQFLLNRLTEVAKGQFYR